MKGTAITVLILVAVMSFAKGIESTVNVGVSADSIEESISLEEGTLEASKEESGSSSASSGSSSTHPERCWGGSCHGHSSNNSSNSSSDALPFFKHSVPPQPKKGGSGSTGSTIPVEVGGSHSHVPGNHLPPDGFRITARVISSHDGLSYFAEDNSSQSLIPFLECGAVGLTTQPIPLRHLNFRHLPPQKANPAFSNTGPNPQLVICLHPLQITVSGDPTNPTIFDAGDVILMEDSVGRGHKISALKGEEKDLSLLILTLPHHHPHHNHHVHSTHTQQPCKTEKLPAFSILSPKPMRSQKYLTIRRLLLSTTGMTLSSMFTYFLMKVAPHVLAVGVGGLCVIVGGTCGVVNMGENVMDEFESWKERKRIETLIVDEGGTGVEDSYTEKMEQAYKEEMEQEEEEEEECDEEYEDVEVV